MLNTRGVLLVAVERVGRASELVGRFVDGQEAVTGRALSAEGNQESDDLEEQRGPLIRRQEGRTGRITG